MLKKTLPLSYNDVDNLCLISLIVSMLYILFLNIFSLEVSKTN